MKLSSKKTALSIAVGDKVTTEFIYEDRHVIRTVTRVEHGATTGSTVRIWAGNGGLCDCCGRPLSRAIEGVDGAWFIPVNSSEGENYG